MVAYIAHVESIKCAYLVCFKNIHTLYGGNYARLYSVAEFLWC